MRKVFLVPLVLSSLMVFAATIRCADAFAGLSYPGNFCVSFDGVDDFIECNSLKPYNTSRFTIELWMKPKYPIQNGSDNEYGHEIGSLVCVGNGWELDLSYEHGFLLFRSRHEPIILSVHGGRETWEPEWYHIAVTYDPDLSEENLKFYVNGALEWTHDPSLRVITYNSSNIKIGQHQTCCSWSFGGLIDEVRYWNVCRSSNEIHDAYSRVLTDVELHNPELIGYWRFDEGSGMTSQDYSMQNNDALFGNPPSNPSWSVPDMPTIPESLTLAILPLLIAATLVTSLICKKKP
jgi:hypothetical protein